MHEENVLEWIQRRPLFFDVPLAAIFALLYFATGPRIPYGVAGILFLGLVFRRVLPAWSFAAVSIGMAVRALGTEQIVASDFVFLVSMYSLGAYEKRRFIRLAGVGVAALGSALGAYRFTSFGEFTPKPSEILFTFFACFGASLASWLLGEFRRTRLRRIDELRERAEHLEREREQELKLAAQQERASIAREMHDVVAHALSVIVVQSDGAVYAAERRPVAGNELSVAALKTIGATARDALGETRRLVGVLRDPDSGMELTPTGGLDHVDDLIDRVRDAGVLVTVERTGEPGEGVLPVGVDLAAYRVIQEALTNVIKHAGRGAEAHVTIDHTPRQLRITVADNGVGAGAESDGKGHGLHGMRERVLVHDGMLTAGPLPERGFEVRATLPLEPPDDTIMSRFRRGARTDDPERVSSDD